LYRQSQSAGHDRGQSAGILSILPSEIMHEGNVQKNGTRAAKACEYELEESKGMTHGPGRDLRTGCISLEHVVRIDELSHSP
jgi:hypothetical protein